MRKEFEIRNGDNSFLITLKKAATFVKIKNKEEQILQYFRSHEIKDFLFFGNPGAYFIETDGKILNIESTIEKFSTLNQIVVSSNGVIISSINGKKIFKTYSEAIQMEIISIEELKRKLIEFYSFRSIEKRRQFIPDYKLMNCSLGVYEEEHINFIKSTIQAFRREFSRLKSAIASSQDPKDIEIIKDRFSEIAQN